MNRFAAVLAFGLLAGCAPAPRGWLVELQGSVLDAAGIGLSGVQVQVENTDEQTLLGEVVTDTEGVWRLPVFVSEDQLDRSWSLSITADSPGFVSGQSFWDFSWVDDSWLPVPVSLGPGQEVDLGPQRTAGVVLFEEGVQARAEGWVRDATNGDSIGQATIRVRRGWNAPSSFESLAVTTSRENGRFELSLDEPGIYTLEAETNGGFEVSRVPIRVGPNGSSPQTVLMSPRLQGEELRGALIWRNSERNLDLHMSGPLASEGGRYQVYVSDTPHPIYGDPIAQMEFADENWETVGVYTLRDGSYRFSAHDREYGMAMDSFSLAQEEPTLLLWSNTGPVMESLAPGVTGTIWQALEYRPEDGVFYRLQGMSEGKDEWDVSAF